MLLTSLDRFGLPLGEGVEIEVKFSHNGKPAKAVYDVWAKYDNGSHLSPGGRDLIDGHAEFQGAEYEDGGSIDPSELSKKLLSSLEDEAFEIYADRGLNESADAEVIRIHLDRARKEIKKAVEHVRGIEASHDPKSHTGSKIRGSKMSLIEVEKVLVDALAKAESMLDRIKRL